MQVRREGKANHYFHREPCGRTREGAVEASVAARVAGMIEHRKRYDPERRGFLIDRRQHLQSRHGEGLPGSALSEESRDARTPLYRDSGGLQFASAVVPGPRKKGDKSESMTNELKQSDSVIVPVKSANKGTSVPAEPMEERTGTKGNLRSQSMHRTQGRARMVTSGGADTASSHEETEGEAHCSSAPHHDGRARRGLLLVEEGRCGRRGRDDVA